MDSKTLIQALEKRYATKKFDTVHTIPHLENIVKDILALTPTSFGLQAQKFLFIIDEKIREQLKKESWNQSQVTDAQVFVVFCVPENFGIRDIEDSVTNMSKIRNADDTEIESRMKRITGAVLDNPSGIGIDSHEEWLTRQLYIALGNIMSSLAILGIDTCPLEGISPEGYSQVLGLKEKGLIPKVALAIGMRSPGDGYQYAKKARFPHERLFEEI